MPKPPSNKPARPSKTANDVLVADPDAAMRKFQQVTGAILNVPKAEVDAIRAKGAKAKPVKKR